MAREYIVDTDDAGPQKAGVGDLSTGMLDAAARAGDQDAFIELLKRKREGGKGGNAKQGR